MAKTPTTIIPTFESLVQNELAKYDSVIPAVEELKAEFLSLKISNIDDEENYQKVAKGIRFIIGKRVAIEDKRKELKADSLAYGKAVDSRAREITSMITPIEEYLKDEKARVDAEIEEIKQREEQLKQQKISDRHNTLIRAGMDLIGNQYQWVSRINALESETLVSINLETMDDDDFDSFVTHINSLVSAEKEKIAEEEERQLKIRQEQERQREELLEQQKQMKEEQDKLLEQQNQMREEQENLKKELEEMKLMRTKSRLTQLYDIGLVSITHLNAVCYKYDGGNYTPVVLYPDVSEATPSDWGKMFTDISVRVADMKKEDDERKAIEKARIEKEAEDRAAQKLKEQQAADIKAKEAEEKIAAIEKEAADKAEQERLAGLSDKEKVAEYCNKLLDIQAPELKTLKWNKELKVISATLNSYLL